MRAECLPIGCIPHISKIYKDFLTDFPKVSGFYSRIPLQRDWCNEEAKSICYPLERRKQVVAVLEQQNRKWGASAKTLANIERLRNGAAAVVTGQQICLFGGQLMAFLKAMTAIKVAEEATAAGVDSVPVFWLATEDHDLAEVSSLNLYEPGHELRQFSASSAVEAKEGAQVGGIRFKQEIETIAAQAAEILGESEVTDWLRRSYVAGATLGDSYARFFAKAFSEFGLILIDNSAGEFHEIARPIFSAAAERTDELNSALLARDKELDHAGYHSQVKVTNSTTLLFTQQDGVRMPVQKSNGKFAIGKEKISHSELVARVSARPQDFSANALLRPVIQDYLLPTLAYIGGPAEVAYFAQSAVLYEKLLDRVTPILARASATIVDAKIAGYLNRYGIKVPQVFTSAADVRNLLGRNCLPAELTSSIQSAKDTLESHLVALSQNLEALDPTLKAAADNSFKKMRYQLGKIEMRAAAAMVRKNQDLDRHAQRISNALFPSKDLQEREIGGAYFLARYGAGFLAQLHQSIQTNCPGHQLLFL